MVLLWGLGVFFLLPLAVAPFALFELGWEKIAERRWPVAAAHLLGVLLTGTAWLAAAGYCGYRAFLAIP